MSDQGEEMPEQEAPSHGVVVRAKNGDVIRYDPTGLVMRLSDKVIEDIALRMNPATADAPSSPSAPTAPAATPSPTVPDGALEGIDAWNVTADGDWLRFTARMPGAQGTRGFRRLRDGGAVLSDTPGPIWGILGLGGPRAALATPGAPAFPHHIVAPEDDIGAVGMGGIEPAPATDRLEPLREVTHEALVAQTLLHECRTDYAPLPLVVTRAETDSSASAQELSTGMAVQNLLQAAQNLAAAAATMGKKAKLLAVCLDYALEDVTGDPIAYRDGMLATMRAVEDGLWALGFDKPLFIARFENGLSAERANAVLNGQWELSWNHGDHKLIYAAPAYMFAHDAYDRPTEAARAHMATMTAAAIREGTAWRCPTLFLAERVGGDPSTLRVTAQAALPLRLAGGDTPHGFTLIGETGGATITSVTIDPDDPLALLLTCDRPPDGDDLRLGYAVGVPAGLSDEWAVTAEDGTVLHRCALPAILPVHGGPNA